MMRGLPRLQCDQSEIDGLNPIGTALPNLTTAGMIKLKIRFPQLLVRTVCASRSPVSFGILSKITQLLDPMMGTGACRVRSVGAPFSWEAPTHSAVQAPNRSCRILGWSMCV